MATSCFEITFETQPDLELFDGASTQVDFTVTNKFEEFRNVAFRVAVMNTIGQENPGAEEIGWFEATTTAAPLLQAGKEMSCTVRAAVPKGTGKRRIVWALVAYDKDLGDEPRFFSQPLSLDVKNVPPPPPEPVEKTVIPWWVWLIVGGAVIGIVVAVIIGVASNNGEEPETPSSTVTEVLPPEMFDLGVVVFDAAEPNPVLSSASVALSLVTSNGAGDRANVGGSRLGRDTETLLVATGTTDGSGEAWFKICTLADSQKFAEKHAGWPERRLTDAIKDLGCVPLSRKMVLKVSRSGFQDSVARSVGADELGDSPKTVPFGMVKVESGGGGIGEVPWPEIVDRFELADYQVRYLDDRVVDKVRVNPELVLEVEDVQLKERFVLPGGPGEATPPQLFEQPVRLAPSSGG